MQLSNATYWLILALVLAGLEMVTGTFYLLAIAMGVFAGAVAAWAGLAVPAQILIASVAGVFAVGILHYWRKSRLPPPENNGALEIGQRVQVLDWKDAQHARVQYRGTQWDGELASDALAEQKNYFIVAVRGSTLILHQNQPG